MVLAARDHNPVRVVGQLKRNPVKTADSINVLDLLCRLLPILRGIAASPVLIAEVREQKLRHHRALVSIIGDEPIDEEDNNG